MVGVLGSRAGVGLGARGVCFLLALELGGDREPLALVSLQPLIEWWLSSCCCFYQKDGIFRRTMFAPSVVC